MTRKDDTHKSRKRVKMADGGCWPTMDLLRSEPMQLVQLIIPTESVHRAISYLGDLGLFQFKDLNAEKSPFQRTYAAQIKRCGEMARKPWFSREQMTQAGISPSRKSTEETEVDLDNLEVKLVELEAELLEINANNEELQHTYHELLEYELVLQKAGEFFSSAKNSATAHQRELEVDNTFEGSRQQIYQSSLSWGSSVVLFLEKNQRHLKEYYFVLQGVMCL